MSKIFYTGFGKTTNWELLPNPTSLTYDDVTLVTQNSSIKSRSFINTTVQFGPYTLKLPIINAPMDTVGSEKLIRVLAEAGGIGCLPRYRKSIDEILPIVKSLTKDDVPCLYAVGLKTAIDDAKILKKAGVKMILVDVAHGGVEQVVDIAAYIQKELKISATAGNITTFDQAQKYKQAGLKIARVGVGGGAVCITREVAGVGMPQLAAVFDTVETGIDVIADGGVKGPKDVVKAIAAGAKIVMIGSLFAGTDEAPKLRDEKGNLIYRGQASKSYMNDRGTVTNEFRAAEGVEVVISEKGPLTFVLEELSGGLRSAMSYTGAKTIEEFQKKAIFNVVSHAAHLEGTPHMRFR